MARLSQTSAGSSAGFSIRLHAPLRLPDRSPAPVPARAVVAAQGLWSFAYTITIRNTGEVPAQLISRHWIITNELGEVEEVKGLGVVGQQPLLKAGEAFEYTSGCRLRTASGTMQGSYFCVAEDGERFEGDRALRAGRRQPPGPALSRRGSRTWKK